MNRWVSSRALDIESRFNPFHDDKGKFSSGGGGGDDANLEGDEHLSGAGKELKGTEGLSGVTAEQGAGLEPMPSGKGEGKGGGKGGKGAKGGEGGSVGLGSALKSATGGLGFGQFAIGAAILSPADGQHLKITHQISASATHATVAGQLLASGQHVTRTFAKYGHVDPNAKVATV